MSITNRLASRPVPPSDFTAPAKGWAASLVHNLALTFAEIVADVRALLENESYAEIYVKDGVTAQVLNASAGTFNTLTGFATNGLANNASAVVASDKIVCVNGGIYLASLSISFSGDASTVYRFQLYNSTTAAAADNCYAEAATDASGSIGSASFAGLVRISAEDEVVIRAASDTSSANITPKHASFTIHRVGRDG